MLMLWMKRGTSSTAILVCEPPPCGGARSVTNSLVSVATNVLKVSRYDGAFHNDEIDGKLTRIGNPGRIFLGDSNRAADGPSCLFHSRAGKEERTLRMRKWNRPGRVSGFGAVVWRRVVVENRWQKSYKLMKTDEDSSRKLILQCTFMKTMNFTTVCLSLNTLHWAIYDCINAD